jgi:SAM-dependent methyltransferase
VVRPLATATDKVPTRIRAAAEIKAHFEGWQLGEDQAAYLDYHARRFELLLTRVDELLQRWRDEGEPPPLRILDVGAGFQTELMKASIPDAAIDSLGFSHPTFTGSRHYWFDLNDAVDQSRWPDARDYHLLVLAEVIEHVHTPPATVLRSLAATLRPGGFLIVQTPNAVALHKRMRMLVGRHPYTPLVDSRHDPMHFRENTPGELRAAGREAGLELLFSSVANYFNPGGAIARAYNALGALLPPTMRTGITAAFRRPPS